MNERGSKTHTIVMQSSWELHNIITYLHNLIHLISIGDASSPPLVELALPYDPQGRWWEWGNNFMYRRCLQLARWWLEYNPLWWEGRFRPTSVFVLIFFSQIEPRIVPLQKECINRNCFSSHRLSINHLIGWRRGKDFWL